MSGLSLNVKTCGNKRMAPFNLQVGKWDSLGTAIGQHPTNQKGTEAVEWNWSHFNPWANWSSRQGFLQNRANKINLLVFDNKNHLSNNPYSPPRPLLSHVVPFPVKPIPPRPALMPSFPMSLTTYSLSWSFSWREPHPRPSSPLRSQCTATSSSISILSTFSTEVQVRMTMRVEAAPSVESDCTVAEGTEVTVWYVFWVIRGVVVGHWARFPVCGGLLGYRYCCSRLWRCVDHQDSWFESSLTGWIL
jgi:hypothetical protein